MFFVLKVLFGTPFDVLSRAQGGVLPHGTITNTIGGTNSLILFPLDRHRISFVWCFLRRAGGLQSEYDQRYQGTVPGQSGPLVQRLDGYGKLWGLVVGPWGEGSKVLHSLALCLMPALQDRAAMPRYKSNC